MTRWTRYATPSRHSAYHESRYAILFQAISNFQNFYLQPNIAANTMSVGWNYAGILPATFTVKFEKAIDNGGQPQLPWIFYAQDTFAPALFSPGPAGRTYGDSAGDGTHWWRVTVSSPNGDSISGIQHM